MNPLYFDCNATTPTAPSVFEAMRPFLTTVFGNPGSAHAFGLEAKRGVDAARGRVAGLIGAAPEEIVFTSCATEADNMVLEGMFADRFGHLIISAIEHPAVLAPAARLARRGVDVDIVPVDGRGLVDPADIEKRITPKTRLISVMTANNETGVIQPVAEIAALARERGIAVHTDAAQAVGKIPVDVSALGVDLLTIAGHKFYAPKGVGALFVRSGTRLSPLLVGGGQEGALRPGTENTAYIAGLGEACVLAGSDLAQEGERQRALGTLLRSGLEELRRDAVVLGDGAPVLPNTLYMGFGGLKAPDLLTECVMSDIALSAGAACCADRTDVSHVLAAMETPRRFAEGALRFSWGRFTTQEDVEELLARFRDVFDALT